MALYQVYITRHIVSYRLANETIDAPTPEGAAKAAAQLDLQWLEDDAIDEGPVDYAVYAVDGESPLLTWREDAGEQRGPSL